MVISAFTLLRSGAPGVAPRVPAFSALTDGWRRRCPRSPEPRRPGLPPWRIIEEERGKEDAPTSYGSPPFPSPLVTPLFLQGRHRSIRKFLTVFFMYSSANRTLLPKNANKGLMNHKLSAGLRAMIPVWHSSARPSNSDFFCLIFRECKSVIHKEHNHVLVESKALDYIRKRPDASF